MSRKIQVKPQNEFCERWPRRGRRPRHRCGCESVRIERGHRKTDAPEACFLRGGTDPRDNSDRVLEAGRGAAAKAVLIVVVRDVSTGGCRPRTTRAGGVGEMRFDFRPPKGCRAKKDP
jgi:hypothetical protein